MVTRRRPQDPGRVRHRLAFASRSRTLWFGTLQDHLGVVSTTDARSRIHQRGCIPFRASSPARALHGSREARSRTMTVPALPLGLLRDRLGEARNRTLELVAPLSDSAVTRQHNPLMSPIVWDLGHIAHFEEVWLLENIDGAGSGAEGLRGIYDAFRHPRATRDQLPLPDRATCLAYLADVRRAVLQRMDGIDPRADAPLLRGAYVFNMVLQHEYQHNETILQTLQLM
ncbi:MAG: hypothetical protein F4Z78_12635, partial [Gammaproteobacteria bacterium]|nr:hypothetical protein [Gammaproteobacteria bacterium]